jgi:FkbM family methyltransferase
MTERGGFQVERLGGDQPDPETGIPAYLLSMARREPPVDQVVPRSTPVVSFGNALVAEVATLGINPSASELVQKDILLQGTNRRLATLDSLGASNMNSLTLDQGTRRNHASDLAPTYDVEIRTLDEAGLAGVRFVKADVEGGEREVLDGARATIARDRPIIMLELLSGTHENPAAEVAAVCESFGYEAFIVQRGEIIAALPAISALGKNTSWGSKIESRNVLFLPR